MVGKTYAVIESLRLSVHENSGAFSCDHRLILKSRYRHFFLFCYQIPQN